ncbi:MAG: hypothetical protein WCF48_20805, partial [Terriglobales bacterium]
MIWSISWDSLGVEAGRGSRNGVVGPLSDLKTCGVGLALPGLAKRRTGILLQTGQARFDQRLSFGRAAKRDQANT